MEPRLLATPLKMAKMGKRKRGKRRGRKRRVTTAKGVAKIARAVVNSQEETKKFIHAARFAAPSGFVQVYNPMFQLTQGVSPSQYAGQKVSNVWLRVDYTFWPRNLTTFGDPDRRAWEGILFRILCIKSNERTGTSVLSRFQTNPTGLTAADIFESGVMPASEAVNTERVTVKKDVIRKALFTIPSAPLSTTEVDWGRPVRGRFTVRIAKQWTYEVNNSGFGRNRQFYLCFVPYALDAPADFNNMGDVQFVLTTMYKDS